jgi:protein subunit release factor B
MDTFRCGGKGGQKQNKTSSGVRFTHIESGAVGESREERQQSQNKKLAFQRCIESKQFQIWFKKKVAREIISADEQRDIERQVDLSMREENLQVEYYTP